MKNDLVTRLSDRIYTCRKKAGLSQEQLAEKLGVSRQAVSKWEIGTAVPELENVVAIAKLFGVTCDLLLMDERRMDEMPADERQPKEEIIVAEAKETEVKHFYLSEDQWRVWGPGFISSIIAIAFGFLLRVLIGWIFTSIFGDLNALTGFIKVIYVILSSAGIFFIGVGIIFGIICLIMLAYFLLHNRRHE